MQPGTTATTEIWQWRCGTCRADWKMIRQVTTCSPHGGRCCQGTPAPSAGNLPPPHHHQHHHRQAQEEGTSRALASTPAEGSNAGRNVVTALNPAPAVATQVCWVPDPYLMVQQLREFEILNDEVVAIRVQLQEYTDEIEKGKRDNAGIDWFLALPRNVRDVVVMARNTIESFIAISTAAPVN